MRIVVQCHTAGLLGLLALAAAKGTLGRLDRAYPGRLKLGKVPAPEAGARHVNDLAGQRRLAEEVEAGLKKGTVQLLLVVPPGSPLAALLGG